MEDLVLIDLNGTLISDYATEIVFTTAQQIAFKKRVDLLNDAGIQVGIASDSPLEQLFELLDRLNIDRTAPVLAENGNIFWNGEKIQFIREFSPEIIASIKEQITALANDSGLGAPQDIIAKEFLGYPNDFTQMWGYGINRKASVSVFGQGDFLIQAAEIARTVLETHGIEKAIDFSIDCAPEFNYLGIHPGRDFQHGKRISIAELIDPDGAGLTGRKIWMIGNSNSDFVGTETEGAKSLFVAGSRLTDEVLTANPFKSEAEDFEGTIDCLDQILLEIGIDPAVIESLSSPQAGDNSTHGLI